MTNNNFKSVAAVAAVLTLASLTAAGNAYAQKPDGQAGGTTTQNVNVVNTPTVNVGTMPAVTLAGTPTVSISAASVLSVKDSENPARQPFQFFQSGIVIAAGNILQGVVIPVPAGKRLVIEQLSAAAAMPLGSGETPRVMIIAGVGSPSDPRAFGTVNYVGRSGTDDFQGTTPLRMYADGGGGGVYAELSRSKDANGLYSGSVAGQISVTGYLVNIP